MTDVIAIKGPGTNFIYLHRCDPGRAFVVDPGNAPLVQEALEYGRLTIPSTVGQEKATNIFLQADHLQIRTALDLPEARPEEVFAELRGRKDLFG